VATLQESITVARGVLNDTVATYRWADADLLQYGNDAIDVIADARPELFYAHSEMTCVAGTCIQTFNVADSLGLMDILQVKNGNVVTPMDRKAMSLYSPGWMSETAAAAVHWTKLDDDPNRFLIYPQAPSAQVLIGLYVKQPPEYTAGQTTVLPGAYTHIISDYIVGMASLRDANYAESGRAMLFMNNFWQKLGISNAENQAEKKPE
jgi:hypothetical protein